MPQKSFHRALSQIIPAILSIALVSCNQKSSLPKDDIRYFSEQLEAGMSYKEVIGVLGEPPVNINEEWTGRDSLHIFQYPLSDSTFVRIGVTDKIQYVCLVDDNNNLIEDIVILNADKP